MKYRWILYVLAAVFLVGLVILNNGIYTTRQLGAIVWVTNKYTGKTYVVRPDPDRPGTWIEVPANAPHSNAFAQAVAEEQDPFIKAAKELDPQARTVGDLIRQRDAARRSQFIQGIACGAVGFGLLVYAGVLFARLRRRPKPEIVHGGHEGPILKRIPKPVDADPRP